LDKYNIIDLLDVDSTNTYALSCKENKIFKEGLVVVADYQYKGKGQRGAIWQSEKGKNLIISVVIQPEIPVKMMFDISKIASLSVVDLLCSLEINTQIKWPNDILVNHQKISGILIENLISKDIITHSVIGIGLNVNQVIFNNFNIKATSLKIEKNNTFDLKWIQYKLLDAIKNRLAIYRSGNSLKSEYLDMLFKKDKIALFESNSQRFNGIIRGVTSDGLLSIEIEGKVGRFDLKDIKMLF